MAWYQQQLMHQDAQLRIDINALLDPSRSFFFRVYIDELARGDGLWQHTMPDRANEGGKTFDYRLALPTVMALINVRLAIMKFTEPLFVQTGFYRDELIRYWECLQGICEQIQSYIRETPPVPVEVQCVRRQEAGDKLGQFRNWHLHRDVVAPASINPVGAVDITTGASWIDWNHVQFDEWYLAKGDLNGQDAGYWPPSVGVQFYRPPPAATGLPPLDHAIDEFYAVCRSDARGKVYEAMHWVGGYDLKTYAWRLLRFANVLSPFG